MRIGDRDRNERKPVFPVCRKKHRTFRWKAACRRGAAVLLAGCMILEEGAFALSSYAAEAAAGVDETVYVNLDKYSFEHLAKNEFRCPHKLRIYARRFIVATLDYLHLKELICQIVRR